MGASALYTGLRLALFSLAGLPALALATPYNVSNAQQHQHWQSMTLSLGDERHFRAVETHSYSDATFSVNATQGVCDLPWLEMRVTLDALQGSDTTLNMVPTLVRVDEHTIRQGVAEFITQRGDDGFYAHFYLNELDALLKEMHRGEQLFVAFEQGEREPWHMTFSLRGAADALAHLQASCTGDALLSPPVTPSLYSEIASIGAGRENQ
ncbi:hypothetical protein ACLUEY_13360 [Vreelandella aquamarina]